MINLEPDLIRSIVADPPNTALRLIFADWLDDQGDEDSSAYAEFIRIQCEISDIDADREGFTNSFRTSKIRKRYEKLRKRERSLFKDSGPKWWDYIVSPFREAVHDLGAYRPYITTNAGSELGIMYGTDRGFIGELSCSFNVWHAFFDIYSRTMMTVMPLQHIRLLDFPRWDFVDSDMCVAYIVGINKDYILDDIGCGPGQSVILSLLKQEWPKLEFHLPTNFTISRSLIVAHQRRLGVLPSPRLSTEDLRTIDD